jgi:hypothetical protein
MRLVIWMFVVLTVNVSAAPAMALTVGTRLRVTGPYDEGFQASIVGTFIGVRSDTLLLGQDQGSFEPRAIPINSITKLEESRGGRGNGLKGAAGGSLLGVIVGGALGTALVVSAARGSPVALLFIGGGAAIVVGAIAFGLIGGAAGAAVGSQEKSERWRKVPVSTLNSESELTTPGEAGGR